MHPHSDFIGPKGYGSAAEAISVGLPADLLRESVRRLRSLTLLYAVVFFLAGVLPALVIAEDRTRFLHNALLWAPSLLGIGIALLLAALIRRPRLSPLTALNLGVVFEVASSYAIAAAEFAHPMELDPPRSGLGLSWAAVWVILYSVVVPTVPRRALLAALASLSAVPVVVGLVMKFGFPGFRLPPDQFFFGLVFPYLLVAGMAYVGSRVVYNLGREVTRARELGSYRLEALLGEGGMGEVWRARHRMLARPAAIKLIRPAIARFSEEAARRFEREAQTIARLRSPHTVNLFDFGMSADGACYYVMELLDGLDAEALIRRFGPIPPARAIHLLRQICHSLSEAHACGLVHRDIKPANVFLCRYGEELDFVKVLDFGIVRTVEDPAEPDPVHTRENAMPGTPAFMAPEQVMGGEVDGRADLYSTGCVAYWLLTGQQVFTAETAIALVMQHAQAEPPPPSMRTDQPISRELDALVLSCLKKEPGQRPQSARELSQRLSELDGAEGWSEERARAWWTEHVPASGGVG